MKKPKSHGGMNKEQKREYHRQYLLWYRGERRRNREETRNEIPTKVSQKKKPIYVRTAKIDARKRVYSAVRNGTLVPLPCERCGDCVAEAHHDDYSKPLVISWFCKKHHIERHIELSLRHK